MKSVLILRHAKSSLKDPELTDHDRPLNEANVMHHALENSKNEHLVPEAMISSTVKRARATAEAVAKAADYKGEVTLNRSLYAAGPEAYLDVLYDLSDDYVRVLIVGH